jgi:hypothetical protein
MGTGWDELGYVRGGDECAVGNAQPLPCVRLHPTGNVCAPFLFFPPH